jgi:hypothetical protein
VQAQVQVQVQGQVQVRQFWATCASAIILPP